MKLTNKIEKGVEYYLSLPYAIEVHSIPKGEGGGFMACIPVLGRWSAVGDGDTEAEAISELRALLPSLIEDWIKRGVEIPETAGEQEDAKEYNGKIPLRIPKTLHGEAVLLAKREGVSLNQFVMAAIAEKVGSKKAS